jgi:hypothetical protein
MIIGDLNLKSIASAPTKAYPPLIVYSNTMLACPVAFQFLQTIRRWAAQIFDRSGGMQDLELSTCWPLDIGRQFA